MLIGREKQKQKLLQAFESGYSQFVAVYGRRRVGKTFLVRETFNYEFTFQHAGLARGEMRKQLSSWKYSLKQCGMKRPRTPKTWLEAFDMLKDFLNTCPEGKKTVFLDEMPWMDTRNSQFLSALESFWNGWASARKDILLIACGSATSWILNKLINSKGGLRGRVTAKIKVSPFTLAECERFVTANNLGMGRRQIAECYMVMGGVPYYWSLLTRSQSLAQNIDSLFFNEDGELYKEYDTLYASLFNNPEPYIKIIGHVDK